MCDSRECAQLTQAARSLPEQPHPAEGAGCPVSAHPDSETAMSLRTGVPAGRAFRSLRPQRLCRWPLRPSCLRPGSLRWGHCHARARRARLWARPAVGHVAQLFAVEGARRHHRESGKVPDTLPQKTKRHTQHGCHRHHWAGQGHGLTRHRTRPWVCGTQMKSVLPSIGPRPSARPEGTTSPPGHVPPNTG